MCLHLDDWRSPTRMPKVAAQDIKVTKMEGAWEESSPEDFYRLLP